VERKDIYVPVVAQRLRRRALQGWAVGLTAVFSWLLAILLAPASKSLGITDLSGPLYNFFGLICHQIPERSFFLAGEPFGVCSRCFGVYFGLFAGFAIYPLWRTIEDVQPLPRVWLFLSLVPITVDWSLTIFHIWENTYFSRFVTGTILGVACATYIVPAMVEVSLNLTLRHRNQP